MKTPLMSSSKSGGKAPHCKVCGDESSGFHYGVDSCEGCKGFFRRCITQGMNHKCANEEKCEITPFTRNSCQYCRLKKCFEVGMSREASRLGRRPKRLKEVGGEGSGGARAHMGNLPIAPYPSPQELLKPRMAEMQKLLQTNGTFKTELMQAFLAAAKQSFQEHSKAAGSGVGEGPGKIKVEKQQQQMVDMMRLPVSLDVLPGSSTMPGSSSIMPTSSASETQCTSTDSAGVSGIGGLSGVDSPSSLHGHVDFLDLNLALDNFLQEQGIPSTPGEGQQSAIEMVAELAATSSPFNLSNVDPVSTATSPLSDSGVGSPLIPPSTSSMTNGGGSAGGEFSAFRGFGSGLNNATSPSVDLSSPSTSVASPPLPQTPGLLQQHQQYPHQHLPSTSNPFSPGFRNVQVKVEPNGGFGSPVLVKTEPISPEPAVPTPPPAKLLRPSFRVDPKDIPATDVNAIMEEVRQIPSDDRRNLLDQVTDKVVEAHLATTLNTYKAIEEANRRITSDQTIDPNMPDIARLKLEADNMWQHIVSAMVPEITKLVRFCKKLPGFTEIEQEDQIRLIKQGSFEVMLARFSLLVNHEEQTMLDPTLNVRAHRFVIKEMPMGEFLDEFFHVSAQFNPLKLTDGEVGLFTAILIICPTRKCLKDPRAISKIQALFQQALYYLMKHNHPDPEMKFRELMGLISTFRRINEEHFKALSSIKMQQPKEFENLPDLHKEVFDGKY